ncbi:MAG TPA: lipopolysaccharide biosynthesis protein [Kofleriaceae bacterium]|nr:lipopolysaccharide biosynthesis protein [Kofleriaceae bacterium]
MTEEPPPRPSQKRMTAHVNRGLAWVGFASSLVGVYDFLSLLIILNFWISPDEYGIATLAVWIYPILDQATDLGLSAAVIQRDDHDPDKISTVFWINLTLAGLLFVALALIAPLAGAAYGHAIIGYMMIAYGTKIIWQNVYFIPAALMKRELRFKELSIIRILANTAEFAGKVGFAWAGFGIWCFVLGPLCRVLVTGVGCQICHPWRPRLVLRVAGAREYIRFGLKSSGSQILFYFYTNVDYPIVGAFFGPTALGIYRAAYEIVLEPVRVISNVVVDVAFPAFAKLRHSRERLIAQLVSFTRLNLITVMTFSALVFVAAPEIIGVFFPKYAGAEDGARILCGVAVLRSVGFVIPPLLDGTGNPHRTFNYMLSAAIVLPLSFLLGAAALGGSLGFLSVAVAWAIGYPIAFGVLIWLASHTLGWTPWGYVRSVAGVAGCMLGAAVVGLGVRSALLGRVPDLVLLLIVAGVIALVTGLLLAYTQGLSLRRLRRALQGDPTADLSSPDLDLGEVVRAAAAADVAGAAATAAEGAAMAATAATAAADRGDTADTAAAATAERRSEP